MLYYLSFLDDDENVQEACKAHVANDDIAIRWMWIVGSVWAQHWARTYEWASMELWCYGRCVARVQASELSSPVVPANQLTAALVRQNLEFLGVPEARQWPGSEKSPRKPRSRRRAH
jgi:hypothetical protein